MRNPYRITALSLTFLLVAAACGSGFTSSEPEQDAGTDASTSGAGGAAGATQGGQAGAGLGGAAGSPAGGSAGSSAAGTAGSSTGGSAGSSTGGSAGSSTGGTAGSSTGGTAGSSAGGTGGWTICSTDEECQPSPLDTTVWTHVGWIEPNTNASCPALAPEEVKLYSASYINALNDPTKFKHTCACACGTASGSCTSDVQCVAGAGCTNTSSIVTKIGNTCADLTGSIGSCKASPLSFSGTCPTQTTKNIPAITADIRACTRSTQALAACGDGKSCMPIPPDVGPCLISKQAGQDCPAGYGAYKPVVAPDRTDTRECDSNGCGCAPVTCSCIGGPDSCRLNLFTGTTCGTQAHQIPLNGACYEVPSSGAGTTSYSANAPSTSTGSCNPTGESIAIGGVAAKDGWTVCCM